MTRPDGAHRGPLVNLAAWITLCAMVVFTFAKIATKWAMVRKFQRDDYMMVAAMVCLPVDPTVGSSDLPI